MRAESQDLDSIRISYHLSGLEASTSGGLHIDKGFSCANSLLVLGHYYKGWSDPWKDIMWNSDSNGDAIGVIVLNSGYSAILNWGHALVVFDSYGISCGCGLIGNEEIIAYI